MTSESQNLQSVQPSSDSQDSDRGQLTSVNSSRGIDLYPPRTSPLPGNRPIADNDTEDMDEMLGYLD